MSEAVSFSRRPIFWILLSTICFGGIIFAFKYFAQAFPIVTLDIKIDRRIAFKQAKELAQKNSWGPDQYQQTASFTVDSETKNFIELEGGGKEALNSIIAEKLYAPYTWQVRHFKEYETNETNIFFMPDGTPYGFIETIAEDEPGAALDSEHAQSIAQEYAQKKWNYNFDKYTLIESAQDKKPNGRIDHTFTYELKEKKVGTAAYRLTIKVSGQKVTELTFFIKVPEAFKRRYQEMRSTNTLIASIAELLYNFLYLIIGTLGSIFFLTRKNWVIWKRPWTWALLLAFLSVLTEISNFPLLWMTYDTALAKNTIYIQFILQLLATFSVITILYGLVFAAAESLSRLAFPQHIQLWKIWTDDAAASIQTLGRTLGGYLLIGFDFAFVVAMYAFASKYLGWWNPSSALVDPNILATYFPWLDAVVQSLDAGFFEECAFRAVPLSCAMLIGKYFNRQRLFLALGFIVQALIFGAAHAHYPSQPAYSRIIELIVPSFIFGGIYIIFGLLPAIISHFIYDVIWFALPIFLSHAPYIWIDQALVVVLSILPLLRVFYARVKQGAWKHITSSFYNYAWQPSTPPKIYPEKKHVTVINQPIISLKYVTGILLFGSLLWIGTTKFKQDGLTVQPTRNKIIPQAKTELTKNNITLTGPWKQFAWIESETAMSEQIRFVWETDKEWFKRLLGNYLSQVHWHVRYAQFEGNVAQREEEYNLYFKADGTFKRLFHQFSEAQSGASLSESDARTLAKNTIQKHFNLTKSQIEEISATSFKKPNRLDWEFIFKDLQASIHKNEEEHEEQGQARIAIEIAGDQIADYYQYVFVPEDWSRTYKHQKTILALIESICRMIIFALLIGYALQALFFWVTRRFATGAFFVIFIALMLKSGIQTINLLPLMTAYFSTANPFFSQLIRQLNYLSPSIMARAGIFALLVAFSIKQKFYVQYISSYTHKIIYGISVGIGAAGILSFARLLLTKVVPRFADYMSASAYVPTLSSVLYSGTSYIYATVTLYCIFHFLDLVSKSWQKNKILTFFIAVIAGIIVTDVQSLTHFVVLGSILGLSIFLAYIFLVRVDRTIVPIIAATYMSANIIQEGMFNAYPGARTGALIALALIGGISLYYAKILQTHKNKNYE